MKKVKNRDQLYIDEYSSLLDVAPRTGSTCSPNVSGSKRIMSSGTRVDGVGTSPNCSVSSAVKLVGRAALDGSLVVRHSGHELF